MVTQKKEEVARRANQITRLFLIIIVMAFLINAFAAFMGRDDAHAVVSAQRSDDCPKGQDSISPDRYWADSDITNNWRLGEINIKAHACYGKDGKIKSSSADLYVRTNSVGSGLGYEIYRLPGNDYVVNHNDGLYKEYGLYAQYHECLIPIPGGGLLCNHTGTVRFEITIWSPKAMHDLGQYAPRDNIAWLWTPRNEWAKDHFELFTTP